MSTKTQPPPTTYHSTHGLTIHEMPFRSMAELKAMKHRPGVCLEFPVIRDQLTKKRGALEVHGVYDTMNDGPHVIQVQFGNGLLKGVETKYQSVIGLFDFSQLPSFSYKLFHGDT